MKVKVRVGALRACALAACLLTLGAACGSSDKATPKTSPSATTTKPDPNLTPNAIPFAVGTRVGLSNGWRVTVAKVRRPYSNPRLPGPAAARQYVALDVTIANDGTTTETVNAADLFTVGDESGRIARVVAVPDQPNGLDGSYPPQTARSGQLVFEVPTNVALRLGLDGPQIGTQRAVFAVDPPTPPPGD